MRNILSSELTIVIAILGTLALLAFVIEETADSILIKRVERDIADSDFSF